MGKTSKLSSAFIFVVSFAVPLLAFAAGINTSYIQGYASSITSVINDILVPVLIAIAFLVFLWGVYKYFIKGADSDTERATGRTFVLYGIIGFVVLFSVWGIVQIFMGTLNLGSTNAPTFPTIGSGNPSTGVNSSFPGTNSSGSGTSGGTYPTTPTNGTCPAGKKLDSSGTYCISTNSGTNTAAVQACADKGGAWNLTDNVCSI